MTTEEEGTDNGEDDSGIDTNLSSTEKLQIMAVFTALRDLYGETSVRTTFFNTLLGALQDKIDSLDDHNSDDQKRIDALQYLYDLVENYLGDDVIADLFTDIFSG